ncbi:ATP-binding protein [Staphylococcus sp. SQ8-PEA]|uniref:histidine kinase n=1 Tax=Staphylococcus marylandisciuri TaxID=2981529 RepID=A0ABT2QQ51_9STAP|nr:ATP-binding protein [Staphylococcus marylandisciuri]MCU5746093.1 ATP-binding protein [Staphylococcus marylandisciuri]
MLKFHQRLLILLWSLTIVSLLLLGFIITHVVSQTVADSHERELDHEAQHYIDLVKDNKTNQVHNIAKNKELTIHIEKNGKDIFTTEGKVKVNPEINNEANPSTYLYDKYHSNHRFTSKTFRGNYEVIISGTDEKIHNLKIAVWKYIGMIGLFVLVMLYFVVRHIHRTYIRPINEVTYATSLLVDGHYHIRIPESNVKETKALFVTTNNLARRLQILNHEQKLQAHRLTATIENIPSSILMINNKGEIVVANQAYYDNFKPKNYIINERYTDYLDTELQSYIAQGFKTERSIYKQIKLNLTQVHEKYFDMACVPVLSSTRKHLYGLIVVLHDITHLKKLENLRREFVANVSHELKTPITSIKGFSETLLDGAKNDETSLDSFLSIIYKESDRIESLVTDLLDLSHIEQQNVIKKEKFNFSALCLETMMNLEHLAEEKDIHLQEDIEQQLIINGNKSKLTQVIVNLLSNAISYSREDSEVVVSLYTEDNQCKLEVRDSGIGISEEDQAHIFERFYRVDKARSRDSGGTGLGLSITKHIVEAHNGQIEVESELGVGTTFRVTLEIE